MFVLSDLAVILSDYGSNAARDMSGEIHFVFLSGSIEVQKHAMAVNPGPR
jgi:hypothetical protein